MTAENMFPTPEQQCWKPNELDLVFGGCCDLMQMCLGAFSRDMGQGREVWFAASARRGPKAATEQINTWQHELSKLPSKPPVVERPTQTKSTARELHNKLPRTGIMWGLRWAKSPIANR